MAAQIDAERRERQQKALGAAFLAHQVTQLEKSVDSLSFDRSQQLYDPKGGPTRRGARAGPSAAARSSPSQRAGAVGRSQRRKGVRVLDASVLVHALPLVKLWVREDQFKLIVPLSVISTLDQLKQAPTALHDQARLATQFLDAQFSIARQISATSAAGSDPHTIRLRAQALGEEVPWSDVVSHFAVPDRFEVDYPEELVRIWSEEAETDLAAGREPRLFPSPEAELIPKEVRPTMQCALYFHHRAMAAASTVGPVSLVVYPALASPPSPSAILFPPPTAHDQPRRLANATQLDFLTLSSGDRIATLLDTFYAPLQVEVERVARAEVDAARDWFRDKARAAQAVRMKQTEIQPPRAIKPPTQVTSAARRAPAKAPSPPIATPSAPTKVPATEGEKEKERPRRAGRSRGRGNGNKGEAKMSGTEKSAPPSVKRTNSSNKPRPTSGTLFVP